MDLPLSAVVIKGLQNLGTSIPLDLVSTLIKEAIKQILNPNTTITHIPELYDKYGDHVKQSEYAVVTLLTLGIKYGLNEEKLRERLESLRIKSEATEILVQMYKKEQKDLLFRQLQTGYQFPHVTDIEWRIVTDVKSSTSSQSLGEVSFLINLGRYNQSGEREIIVEFLSNTEELQLLINKLKEIERHCDKVANEVG